MIIVRPLQPEDFPQLIANARAADIEEARDGAGLTIAQSLELGMKLSAKAMVFDAEGVLLAAFGDAKAFEAPGVGVPWLISTNAINKHSRGFLRACRPLVQEMLQRNQVLTNFVDDRNEAAKRWLAWLGFDLASPVPAGRLGLPFRKFIMTRS